MSNRAGRDQAKANTNTNANQAGRDQANTNAKPSRPGSGERLKRNRARGFLDWKLEQIEAESGRPG